MFDCVCGICELLGVYGLDFDKCIVLFDYLYVCGNDFEYGCVFVRSFVECGDLFMVFIVLNDEIVVGVMYGLKEFGVCVLDDVFVIGFNN